MNTFRLVFPYRKDLGLTRGLRMRYSDIPSSMYTNGDDTSLKSQESIFVAGLHC